VIDPDSGAAEIYDEPAGGQWSRLPSFPSGGGGLVSTVDDFLAFADMLRGKGVSRGERILSRPSVEFTTSDQLTPEQKAASGLVPGFFRVHGWGFGVAVVTERTEVAKSVGTYGWDGGMGTSWYNDPAETSHDPHDPAGLDLPHPAPAVPGLLDRHLPGHRRLTVLAWGRPPLEPPLPG